ncbi:mediator of RNA polymerase II transcription subunit 15a-like isoform X2 [Durio zibethinus]|uniref:Mediator of RNA polymerase II transcription subunit 15a-like isoform X2 n=1 Tax=Durio zibethinus TaxID=66656 RepID=A0A6P5WFG9_DURZI|nr:mediator of RNA polymerase II transcription subunit 15a-like isoform X2 [Durio zibethinus]
MDTNNWRPTPASGEPTMDTGDWRTQLQPDSRQRIVNKIMDTLKRHLPFSGQEGLNELRKIAVRFEEKIFTAANSQSDYLRRISLKMLTMENKSENTIPNTGNNSKAPDPGFENANDTHSNALTTDFGESKDTEEPHVPRVTMAKPMSLKSLEASIVVMVEEAATAVGVDMAALSKGGLHRRNFFPQTGMTGAEKMRFYMSALAILALMFWFIIIASA